MRPLATYLRSLDPMLPRQVWLVEAGGVVNSLGNGIVFPFIVIYLHNVRGISFAAAGLALSAGAVGALAAGFGAGTIVDRFGGRNTLLLGLVLQAASFALFPLIREAWHAFALLALEGAGTACFWPGQSTLLSRLTPAERTHSAFALQRISMNLGLGLGGVIGGLIASTSDPSSFTTLFLLDAATFVVFIGVLSTIREPRVHEAKAADRDALGYRAVFRDRNFVWLLGLIELPVSKALEGHRRMRALALMSLLFAAAALIVLGGGIWFTGTAAALVFVAATLVFGLGEVLQGPTQAPLVADLAPDHLRGRYFALGSMSWSAGSILGPAVGGPLLGWHPLAVWPLAAAISVFAAVGCLALERRLPERVLRSPVGEPLGEGEPVPKPAPA